jgi:SAM-dependent methyltransferase
MTTKQAQWDKLAGHLIGYQATWVVDIGLKTGLFSIIAAAPDGIGEDDVVTQSTFDDRYVRLWCRSAYAFEILEWDPAAGYRLDPDLATLLLDPTDALFMGGRMQFVAALYEDFRAFPDGLRSGGIWPRSEHDPWLLEALSNSTRADSSVWANVVVPQAPAAMAALEKGGRLLDIGSGAGHALIDYAQRFPTATIVGLEPDEPSLELARANITTAGLASRIELRRGDANALEDADSFDLVTLNITLHETGGPDEYANVLQRVHRALAPGGSVLVAELPYPDSPEAYREQPVYRILAGVQLHEALVGCGAITQAQLPQLLADAAFTHIRVADQPMPTRFVVLADKPA